MVFDFLDSDSERDIGLGVFLGGIVVVLRVTDEEGNGMQREGTENECLRTFTVVGSFGSFGGFAERFIHDIAHILSILSHNMHAVPTTIHPVQSFAFLFLLDSAVLGGGSSIRDRFPTYLRYAYKRDSVYLAVSNAYFVPRLGPSWQPRHEGRSRRESV